MKFFLHSENQLYSQKDIKWTNANPQALKTLPRTSCGPIVAFVGQLRKSVNYCWRSNVTCIQTTHKTTSLKSSKNLTLQFRLNCLKIWEKSVRWCCIIETHKILNLFTDRIIIIIIITITTTIVMVIIIIIIIIIIIKKKIKEEDEEEE